ncbi:PrsW family intramembrane metalloprotease [Streptomyces sp. NA04227]|uniref:PrsW family glutamic-type intramembrane protease n=1 Tax=Streptomyces sp. NA04227 TaxID=2742136 RepID=UPI00159108A1|nr:PrsW family glutamic-type intramembrane protease [Streptomyces sp. NA04227]QKW10991.1 PrsW family intramembrane metalloprotease [Streptomyces sp. NA04227]
MSGGAVRHARWWQRRGVRLGAAGAVLLVSGLVILALVREQTGTEGFLVGLGLAVVPVPLLFAAFRWLDRVQPGPWRDLVFAFGWGAGAAALIAILANSFAARWIATTTADPESADTLAATVIAPVVEESAKALAVLLVFLFRRQHFTGLVDGVVIAGLTASGFAFTENILYLGNAFGTDRISGDSGLASVTAATFFVRIVMSPFAHPLFTVLTGIGFGLAAFSAERHRLRRTLLPLAGLLLAMAVHAGWNGSAALGPLGFFAVYALFMLPAFALLTWLAVWQRQRELRTVREELPAYAAAGWLSAPEPYALGSMRARTLAREYAAHALDKAAARTVADYAHRATALALLRRRGRRGRANADFVTRERELLESLWRGRRVAAPALAYAAHLTAPQPPPVPYPAHGWGPHGRPPPGLPHRPYANWPQQQTGPHRPPPQHPYAYHPPGTPAPTPAPAPPPTHHAAPNWPPRQRHW